MSYIHDTLVVSPEECCRILAEAYRDGEPWQIPQHLIENFRDQVEHWFAKIPVTVRFISDEFCKQPFNTMHDMKAWHQEKGELLMLSEHSDQLGRDLYSKHRAVHDWFGHIEPGHPFGGKGESLSFLAHAGQYTPDVLPIVFSDVVLTNNYWQHFGHAWKGERWVNAAHLMPMVRDAYH